MDAPLRVLVNSRPWTSTVVHTRLYLRECTAALEDLLENLKARKVRALFRNLTAEEARRHLILNNWPLSDQYAGNDHPFAALHSLK